MRAKCSAHAVEQSAVTFAAVAGPSTPQGCTDEPRSSVHGGSDAGGGGKGGCFGGCGGISSKGGDGGSNGGGGAVGGGLGSGHGNSSPLLLQETASMKSPSSLPYPSMTS